MNPKAKKKSELFILVKARELSESIFEITDKSPKKFRYSIVTRLQNISLDILQDIILANNLDINDFERSKYQDCAKNNLYYLDSLLSISIDIGCIITKQFETLSKLIAETIMYLDKWIKSDQKRVLANH